MSEKKFVIEVGRLSPLPADFGKIIAEIDIRTDPAGHGGNVRVWIPSKDSIAELKHDAIAELKIFLKAAIESIPD